MSQQNYRHLSAKVLMDIKHSELPSKNTLETPGTLNKRPTLESPQELPTTSKQQTRQARHRSTSVGEKGRSALVCTENKNSSAHKKLTLYK